MNPRSHCPTSLLIGTLIISHASLISTRHTHLTLNSQGSGGGPQENNTTAFLVRSIAQDWRKGSVVAVDAGVHLSAITRILKETIPDPLPESPPSEPYVVDKGPFAGLSLPYKTVEANAGYITSSIIESYLITHPHLDHIAGFVINTAGPPGTRPKKLAGLPSTIQAFKDHIFNNVIWPNLSDEDNGAGLVTYNRLVEGGSPALGDADGYIEIADGLLVKAWSVSHGHCIERHSHRGSQPSVPPQDVPSFQGSVTRRGGSDNTNAHSSQAVPRRQSLLSQATFGSTGSGGARSASPGFGETEQACVCDSSGFCVQDAETGREVLFLGDLEPDSISLSPRNLRVWRDIAPKVATKKMVGIYIECSYEDSRNDERLFGHLKPLYVIEELKNLAAEVAAAKKADSWTDPSLELNKKRKRKSDAGIMPRGAPHPPSSDDPVSPKTQKTADSDPSSRRSSKAEWSKTASNVSPQEETATQDQTHKEFSPSTFGDEKRPLEGLKIVIIHVKEPMADGPDIKDTILTQLLEHEREAQLGCEFVISHSGQAFFF